MKGTFLLSSKAAEAYSALWGGSIQYKYSLPEPYRGKEFSEVLLLAREGEMKTAIDSIKSRDKILLEQMKKLADPPSKYKDLYNAVSTTFKKLTELNSLAVNPTGSLITFNQTIGNLNREIESGLKEIESKIPE